jgi:hypothetical protein
MPSCRTCGEATTSSESKHAPAAGLPAHSPNSPEPFDPKRTREHSGAGPSDSTQQSPGDPQRSRRRPPSAAPQPRTARDRADRSHRRRAQRTEETSRSPASQNRATTISRPCRRRTRVSERRLAVAPRMLLADVKLSRSGSTLRAEPSPARRLHLGEHQGHTQGARVLVEVLKHIGCLVSTSVIGSAATTIHAKADARSLDRAQRGARRAA